MKYWRCTFFRTISLSDECPFQSVEEAFSIFPWQQRGTLGKASSCGNLFEISENLAVRSLGEMSGHFRVRSLGRMSGHCKAEACFGWVTVAVRFSERLNCRMICPFRNRYK